MCLVLCILQSDPLCSYMVGGVGMFGSLLKRCSRALYDLVMRQCRRQTDGPLFGKKTSAAPIAPYSLSRHV